MSDLAKPIQRRYLDAIDHAIAAEQASSEWLADREDEKYRIALAEANFLVRKLVVAHNAVVHTPRLGERWSFNFEDRGAHVEVTIRVGQPGSRALAGEIMLRRDEAEELHRSLGPGALVTMTRGS